MRIFLFLISISALQCQMLCAGTIPLHVIDPQFHFEEKGPFYNLDAYVKWEYVPESGSVHTAFNFLFENGTVGYIASQIYRVNGEVKKKVGFSIWDVYDYANTAIPTENYGNCERFSHEGTGTGCGIDYDWIPNREYRLRVWVLWQLNLPDSEQWYGVIQDTVTGVETPIGVIEVKNTGKYKGYGRLSQESIIFLEHFALDDLTCSKLPYVRVSWRGPYADNNSYTARTATVSYPNYCRNDNLTSKGYPLTTYESGGQTQRTTLDNTNVWYTPVSTPTPVVTKEDSSGGGCFIKTIAD